ncbi:acetyl-CoA carboxylase, biotin carboxyl carrier protein [Chlamydia psittaci VS225]|nr:acetyl-CoA carboxylase, biotin carboxyl carrier protein [Chlamydia psittaci VS225]
MDLKQIEKLMIAMGRNSMKRFVIKREGLELELERDTGDKPNQEPVFYDSRLFAGFLRSALFLRIQIKQSLKMLLLKKQKLNPNKLLGILLALH